MPHDVAEKGAPVSAAATRPVREFSSAKTASSPEKIDPLVGSKIAGRYRITEKIGQGGMGTIYLAEDERLGKNVVVKMLPAAFKHRVDLRIRFAREAKMASQIEHPNIVFITDFVVESSAFYVMEYLKGRDLATILRDEKRLAWDERLKEMLAQVCSALAAAHAKGVIHRDMKPENVFVVAHGNGKPLVKVFDFGIAKIMHGTSEEEPVQGSADIALSATGQLGLTDGDMVVGTPHYMSPEQALGEQVDPRTDIYSLGAMMYELLTGYPPFEMPKEDEKKPDAISRIMEMHIKVPVVPPRQRCPEANIPEEVEAIVMAALQKDPAARFQTIDEMGAAILKCEAPKHKPKPRIRHGGASSESRSGEGLARIAKRDEERRTWARVRTCILVGGLAAAAAGGLAAADYFGLFEPAVETSSVDAPPGQKVQSDVTDEK